MSRKATIVLIVLIVLSVLLAVGCRSVSRASLWIEADRNTVAMGRTVVVTATFSPGAGENPERYLLLPYVNGRRWGSHERADRNGTAEFLLPLPNPGPSRILVVAVKSDTDHWQGHTDRNLLLAGRRILEGGVRSNAVDIAVTWRAVPDRRRSGTFFGVQWEPWFTPQVASWSTAHAVPVVGFYDSYNADVRRQHALWFMDLGVDFIMPDWSNHIWGRAHWDERSPEVNTILHATQLMLETLAEMRDEGLPVPKMAIMPGLSNGPPATMQALNEELEWIYQNYVRNPRFAALWQEFDGKPLVIVLDTGAMAHPKGTAASAFLIPFFKQTLGLTAAELDARRAGEKTRVDDRHFTVRWMSSQNQLTRHHELGYWSWMDGSLQPEVTFKDGKAEAVTVTPAFFGPGGWTGKEAYGRREGWTYLESFKTALKHKPKVVFLHQFNEYAGQEPGKAYGPNRDIYGDSYSVELSDDLEPVSRTALGYRGDRGGWGYYDLNLTQALMAIYRGDAEDTTLLAVRGPYVDGGEVRVEWSYVGKEPSGFSVALDGRPVAERVRGQALSIPLGQVAAGEHRITVTALDATTRYSLSATHFDVRLERPVPVGVERAFTVGAR